MTGRPNVNLQVVPHEVGVHPALQGAFFLLRFEDDWRVAYEETRRSAYYYDSPEAVASCVESGWADGMVGYRDTKLAALPDDERPTLVFGTGAAGTFLAMIRSAAC
jgi:hypothetical protein